MTATDDEARASRHVRNAIWSAWRSMGVTRDAAVEFEAAWADLQRTFTVLLAETARQAASTLTQHDSQGEA